ncbi:MAG: MOFRL family protein, partial [Gammaproteobacteria bacterium]|nr:MOFRL family protein [Gammaproteobacteria bacterium]
GEPTVQLPGNPGLGGRNQSLALALTLALDNGHCVHGVVAGTDGTDGPTEAAGGVVGPALDRDAGRESLAAANAGPWLDRHGRLFVTGPTGTNVMDLAVLIRDEA